MRKKLWKRSMAVVVMLMGLSTGLVVNAEGSYTVKEGDYLKKIAKSVYGDSARWEDIYEANKATVKNPAILYKGQTLILPDIDPAPPVETEETETQTEVQTETQTEAQAETQDTLMTLEQWVVSEEGAELQSVMNELTVDLMGLSFELKADGNKLAFVYHFIPEIWGETAGEEMMASFSNEDFADMNEMMGELVEGLRQEFETSYGIKLDGIRYVYVASDGVPFYTIDF